MRKLQAPSVKFDLDRFMRSPAYIWVLAALALASNLWGLELPVYTLFVLLGIYMSLYGEDYLGLLPIVILCYIAPSQANNPGRNESSVFFPQNGGWFLILLFAAFAASVVYRLIMDRRGGQFLKQKRLLLPGMLLLGGAYLLSGIGYEEYFSLALQNLLFAALQFLGVAACYFFFTAAVRWKRVHRDYFCHIGLAVGTVIALQVLSIFLSGRAVDNGVIVWNNITTGWGINNNMGGMLAIMLPFPFYFASKGKWGFHLWAAAFYGVICLTCSRSAVLFGGVCYALCLAYSIYISPNRRLFAIIYAVAILAVLILMWDFLIGLFENFFHRGFSPSNRDNVYLEGLKQYLKYPIFGGSFYPIDFEVTQYSKLDSFSDFFPPRWHNTLVQLGASCGTVGLAAYALHRVQTVRLFLHRRSRENQFIAMSVLTLLGVSMLDCHFFNIGPTLFYSMALAVVEKMPGNPKK